MSSWYWVACASYCSTSKEAHFLVEASDTGMSAFPPPTCSQPHQLVPPGTFSTRLLPAVHLQQLHQLALTEALVPVPPCAPTAGGWIRAFCTSLPPILPPQPLKKPAPSIVTSGLYSQSFPAQWASPTFILAIANPPTHHPNSLVSHPSLVSTNL